ncbi:NAD(P)H-dependent flavin oxidoreductase [Inconstantimicrobium mannanitabidum]|uniref:2-nitropropane dioxygenase n=1 Tax=Inconstantimicrobium mannanitabidum TaxID=1604901 RepID=A0ACB5R888_9CLOT|nr:nitronate monooxygenase family protein [Clostridium sp. TW13]GKX65393.1 2-nitropropane dioxygenase [Clostridium sp. TW13]
MQLNSLKIKDLEVKVPIIQGGMGVGISLSGLASAVANEGGIGVISAAQVGFKEHDFLENTKEANIRALKKEIARAKELAPKGVIGVNIMVAMNDYDDFVKIAAEAGADVIISGAGLPTDLPKLVEGSNTKIAPIVSSGKAAKIMCKLWHERFSRLPDFVVVEGPEAGGHLGFKLNELEVRTDDTLEHIVQDVLNVVKEFEHKFDVKIPVIAAGGIYTGADIARFLKLGASGVQMGTRFICTEECDADVEYKNAFINCNKEDIQLVKSPVGMPGRAIRNKFIEQASEGNIKVTKCFRCIRKCNPATTVYCISRALINAAEGDVDNALLFTGSNGYRNDKIVTVKELMNELVSEVEQA